MAAPSRLIEQAMQMAASGRTGAAPVESVLNEAVASGASLRSGDMAGLARNLSSLTAEQQAFVRSQLNAGRPAVVKQYIPGQGAKEVAYIPIVVTNPDYARIYNIHEMKGSGAPQPIDPLVQQYNASRAASEAVRMSEITNPTQPQAPPTDVARDALARNNVQHKLATFNRMQMMSAPMRDSAVAGMISAWKQSGGGGGR